MSIPTPKIRWWHKPLKRLAATPFGIWLMSGTIDHIDMFVLKATKNRYTLTYLLSGVPVILLTTIGAKSGLPRQVPLVALAKQEKLILIASFYGNQRHPSWYYNLKANPQAEVSYNGYTNNYIARKSEGEERIHYWEMAETIYPGYNLYKKRAGNREIPIMVLEPI